MKDRLIELMQKWGNENTDSFPFESVADFLVSEGVVVPPCKVGQTVYCIRYDRARKPYIKPLGVLSITTYGENIVTIFTTREDRLGLTAFLTREEAEKALERSENGKS